MHPDVVASALPCPISSRKLAYHTLQQGKSLVGLAHKEVSSRLMDLLGPEVSARTRAGAPGPAGDAAGIDATAAGAGLEGGGTGPLPGLPAVRCPLA